LGVFTQNLKREFVSIPTYPDSSPQKIFFRIAPAIKTKAYFQKMGLEISAPSKKQVLKYLFFLNLLRTNKTNYKGHKEQQENKNIFESIYLIINTLGIILKKM